MGKHKPSSPLLTAVDRYVTLGYACVTASLKWDETTGKKVVFYAPRWQKATRDNCAVEFTNPTHNAIAIVTGIASDLIVVDIDHPKPNEIGKLVDGHEAMKSFVRTHSMSPHVPIATTGSGGKHYFFSASKSIQEGLRNSQNRAKLMIDGRPTTIDVRCDGGNVLCEPTSYNTPTEMRCYTWDTPLCHSDDLPAMPAWLIDTLNADKGEGQSRSVVPNPKRPREVAPTADGDDTFFKRVRAKVEAQMDSRVDNYYPRQPNVFDFDLEDKSGTCNLCLGDAHASNKYRCQQILLDCFYLFNFSSKCRNYHLCDDYDKSPIIAQIIEAPCTDNVYVQMYLLTQRYTGCDVRVTGDKHRFYIFDTNHWAEVDDMNVQQELRLLAFEALDQLCRALHTTMTAERSRNNKNACDKMERDLKQIRQGKAFVQKAGNISAITTSAKQLLWDGELSKKLDTNPDLLGVPHGVIDLRTGEMRRGQQEDHISRVIDTEYFGLDAPTPDIDSFFTSLFEDDEVTAFLQLLLGYGLTGHVKEQLWTICHGCGSNGKGVLQSMLEKLLGDYYVSMSPDCLIKRGRPAGKNAPTPYLADLAGKRLAVCDELPEDAVLDEELVKRATGSGTLTARYLNANPFDFPATHFSILLTNHKPKINVDDPAMLRRIVFVPFLMQFKRPHDMDPADPTHRPIDPDLADKLTTPEVLSQLLTWMVKGAVRWYQGGLPQPPAKMQAALQEYLEENDTVAKFIKEHCIVGRDHKVETRTFLETFVHTTGQTITTQLMARKMGQRGFKKKQEARSVPGRPVVFEGITLASHIDA